MYMTSVIGQLSQLCFYIGITNTAEHDLGLLYNGDCRHNVGTKL